MHRFTNNGVAALAVAIDATVGTITLGVGEGGRFADISTSSGDVQHLTITSPDLPGVVEIIEVYERVYGTDVLEVQRGMEGTAAVAWPAGATVSARVTAGMLESFAQGSLDDYLNAPEGVVPLSRDISGTQFVVQRHRHAGGPAFANTGVEVFWLSPRVNLGVIQPWAPGESYSEGDVVIPTVPNGFQYVLSMDEYQLSGPSIESETTEPVWPTAAGGDVRDGQTRTGSWVAANLSSGLLLEAPEASGILLSEIGFICSDIGGITAPPSISITGFQTSDVFVAGQLLSAIGASNDVHRFDPVPAKMLENVRFKLDTPAMGGPFSGWFYAKGAIIQTGF